MSLQEIKEVSEAILCGKRDIVFDLPVLAHLSRKCAMFSFIMANDLNGKFYDQFKSQSFHNIPSELLFYYALIHPENIDINILKDVKKISKKNIISYLKYISFSDASSDKFNALMTLLSTVKLTIDDFTFDSELADVYGYFIHKAPLKHRDHMSPTYLLLYGYSDVGIMLTVSEFTKSNDDIQFEIEVFL